MLVFSRFSSAMVVTMLSLTLATAAAAADLYVSPTGAADAQGTREQPLDIATALGEASPAKPGDTIYLLGGRYDGPMDGTKRLPFQLAVSGAQDNPIRVMPAAGEQVHLNGTVQLTGSHVHYINLEIGDLKWDLSRQSHQNETVLWATGGSHAKFINCNLFGGSMGTGLWSPAVDLEIYGCLVHDFGTSGEDRGHGHAFYTQNERGTKTISNNIAYRGAGWNLHVYTQSGQIAGFDIIDNIMFIAGALVPNQSHDNYLIAGYPAADRIRVIGNVGYQPVDAQDYRPNARLSSYKSVVNGTAEVVDNYFAGSFIGLTLSRWENIKVTGNTIWSTGVLVELASAPASVGFGTPDMPKPDLSNYQMDHNTYYANGQDKPFRYGIGIEANREEETLSFEQWQALGLDVHGQMLESRDGRPTGSKTFVYPNDYQKGRAHVAVFNWDGQDSVEVDFADVLENGQRFVVYNVLDINQAIAQAEPVVTGTYEGKPVALPMKKDPLSPDFDAFLVLPVE